ncbi:MAG: head-tail connector protein, partial [Cohaesibacteraceae bacterium]
RKRPAIQPGRGPFAFEQPFQPAPFADGPLLMTLVQLVSPAIEPVGLADFKAHARIDTDEDDTLCLAILLAARTHVETLAGKVLITQGWRITADQAPKDGIMALLVRPVQSVDAVTLYDAEGTPTMLEETDWLADLGGRWPRVQLRRPAAMRLRGMHGIEVDVTAGYGDNSVDVPSVLRQAILMLAAHWYDHRATGFDFMTAGEPDGLFALIEPYREVRL